MVDTFYIAARCLADDSYVEIYVWDGDGWTHRIEVVDGRVLHTVTEVKDAYDIDDYEEDEW